MTSFERVCYTVFVTVAVAQSAEHRTVDARVVGSRPISHPFYWTEMRGNKFVSGIPVGTAANRLRKQVLFDLVCRLDLNTCFRCGKLIGSAEELSIDHKANWIDDHDLFWALDNIAFSHLRCNSLASNRSGPRERIKSRKIGPAGTAWCQGHQAFLPIANFYLRKSHWNGLDPYCKECKRSRWKDHR